MGGWVELYPIFWDFWNFFNFANPLTREPLNRGGIIMLLNCTMHTMMLLGCGTMLANREMEIYLNYVGYQRLDTNGILYYALRFIKRNEADMRKESLGNKLADRDRRDFWKEIKGVNNAKMPLPTSIEGVTGESNIASVWRDHYNSVFNSTHGDATQLTFLNAMMLMKIYWFYQN